MEITIRQGVINRLIKIIKYKGSVYTANNLPRFPKPYIHPVIQQR